MAVSGLSRTIWINRILYNGGRILTYGIMGALVGAFGAIAGLTGLQNILSVGLGLLLILFGVVGVSHLRIPFITPLVLIFSGRLKMLFGNQLKSKTKMSLLILGAINGLLPCGLTYFALTYCITLPNAQEGFVFMLTFGAGTLPAMLGLPSMLQAIASRTKVRIQRFSAVMMIALGALLLFRSAYFQNQNMTVTATSEIACP
jgi:sulfite exporter TauE/SafE